MSLKYLLLILLIFSCQSNTNRKITNVELEQPKVWRVDEKSGNKYPYLTECKESFSGKSKIFEYWFRDGQIFKFGNDVLGFDTLDKCLKGRNLMMGILNQGLEDKDFLIESSKCYPFVEINKSFLKSVMKLGGYITLDSNTILNGEDLDNGIQVVFISIKKGLPFLRKYDKEDVLNGLCSNMKTGTGINF